MKNNLLLLLPLALYSFKTHSQCVSNTANVYSFIVSDVPYELLKEKKSWVDAAACAVSRGGKLAEINSKAEQDTIFYYLNQANILPANTVAPDGGGASYVWLGGNDITTEGKWVWDGANVGSTNQFWQGTSSGSAIGGSYTNWGNEPDNWNGQDGLGLAVTNWPLGVAGQWNDVKETNQLYYLIEFPKLITTSLQEIKNTAFSVYPNPANTFIILKNFSPRHRYTLCNSTGLVVKEGTLNLDQTLDISDLSAGIYFLSSAEHSVRFIKTE